MRFMMTARFPLEPFNSLVRDGSAGKILGSIVEDLKPEAIYFVENDGCRCAVMIIDMPTPSDLPRHSEPFFLKFNASCEFRIAMTPEDLGRASLEDLGKKWG